MASSPCLPLLRRATASVVRRTAVPHFTRPPPPSAAALRLIQTPSSSTAAPPPRHARRIVTITQTKAGAPEVVVAADDSDSTGEAAPPSLPPSVATASDTDGVVVTASCAARILQLSSKRDDADSVYLRVYVDAGGCSGFQYKFELESEAGESGGGGGEDGEDDDDDDDVVGIDPDEDVVFVKDGARVVIDRSSLELIRGSTVDFVREMIRSSFAVIGNPQSESACGCGSSFAVKNFEENPAVD